MIYDREYYRSRDHVTSVAAKRVLSLIWDIVAPVRVLDVGCGVGTWLASAEELGAEKVHGLDGPWVPRDLLVIRREDFQACDLEALPKIDVRYDLAICVEVAEHLSPDSGEKVIGWLCSRADVVVFSAAVPDQGGEGHINEQWQQHWQRLFSKEDFECFDVIRPKVWYDDDIPVWYRQNCLVFARRESEAAEALCEINVGGFPVDVVHPELWRRGKAGGGRRAVRELILEIGGRVESLLNRVKELAGK